MDKKKKSDTSSTLRVPIPMTTVARVFGTVGLPYVTADPF